MVLSLTQRVHTYHLYLLFTCCLSWCNHPGPFFGFNIRLTVCHASLQGRGALMYTSFITSFLRRFTPFCAKLGFCYRFRPWSPFTFWYMFPCFSFDFFETVSTVFNWYKYIQNWPASSAHRPQLPVLQAAALLAFNPPIRSEKRLCDNGPIFCTSC